MSRIGKLPITIPEGVKVQVDGVLVVAEGPKGKLQHEMPAGIRAEVSGDTVRVTRESDERQIRAYHGLARKLIANIIQGVHSGFSRTLEINGVGYRAEVRGDALHLSLGYSHPIVYQLPPGVTARVDRQTVITLEGMETQVVGETAATIRRLRPPEPYKGKGIKYADETLRRKAGKAAGAAGGA
jgi:large subunit ribosomal protein L6